MAEIGIANCDVQCKSEGGFAEYLIITPSTADSDDTLDISTLANGRTIRGILQWDSTSANAGGVVTASSNVITVDTSGGTTDHVYNLLVLMK